MLGLKGRWLLGSSTSCLVHTGLQSSGGHLNKKFCITLISSIKVKCTLWHCHCTALRIRDPVLFDPWIRDPGWAKIRIRDEQPGSYIREIRNNFLGLILGFFDADPGSEKEKIRIRDGKNGSEIRNTASMQIRDVRTVTEINKMTTIVLLPIYADIICLLLNRHKYASCHKTWIPFLVITNETCTCTEGRFRGSVNFLG